MDNNAVTYGLACMCALTYRRDVHIYGIRYQESDQYIYVGLTHDTKRRRDEHAARFSRHKVQGYYPAPDPDVLLDLFLTFSENTGLVYEYEHRFTLEYLRLGHPLQIKEYLTDKIDPSLNYLTLPLSDPAFHPILCEPSSNPKINGKWPFHYKPSYLELYKTIRHITNTERIVYDELSRSLYSPN